MHRSSPIHRPFRNAGAAFQIGLKPMEELGWLDTGPDHREFMAEKRERLKGRPAIYYRSIPESWPAQAELRDRIADHLTRHRGNDFKLQGRTLHDGLDGSSHDLDSPALEPLEVAANFTEEDFVLFERRDGADIVTAASNAYTSSGRIVSCVGRNMRFAHEPVPGLNDQLGARIERVMANIQSGQPVVRFNWFITAISSRLFPVGWHEANIAASETLAAALDADPELCATSLWLRIERQTFVRLPNTGALAFGIHTYSDPLSSIADDRSSIEALRGLVSEYSEDRLRYSAMWPIRAALGKWFERQLR